MTSFYSELPSFGEFSDVTNPKYFSPVPSDWVVVVTDIKGSTKAIDEGRYKDVNTLGAASIIAVQNKLGDDTFPFVFGGDGATMVIPPDSIAIVSQQLTGLRRLAEEKFGMGLRVGAVPISELGNDAVVEVAKLEIRGKRCIAIFRGGGLVAAEDLIKAAESKYEIPDHANPEVDLSGLSCRWQPIPSKRGVVLSLLVQSRSGDKAYHEVLGEIAGIFNGDISQANPVNNVGLRYKSVSQCIQNEKRMHSSSWSPKYWFRIIEIYLAVLIFKFGFPGPFDAKKYADSMGSHSDYRKFDDMLRMIVDCSSEQYERLEAYLVQKYEAGDLFYGIHKAETSLMTCYFEGPSEGDHIHFIDGGDGGYALAAKQLKQQIKLANTSDAA